ncbi:MAG: phosphoribosyl-AMP cyclohydrolase [Balneolaceae bacterium]|nr:phosphoribosyl-AMP cyclohydrolase [Balneolaceae bacterium]
MDITKLDFNKGDGLIPAIIQDADTYQVLMLGYMNKPALEKTLEEERVTFFSRTKERLWTKGETSGNYLELVDLQADCDNDTILILANPQGPTCHTGETSCFYKKKFKPPKNNYAFLKDLEDLIEKSQGEIARKFLHHVPI